MNSRFRCALLLCLAALVFTPAFTFAQEKQKKQKQAPAAARLPDGVRKLPDIPYKQVDGQSLKLDLYLPEKPAEKLPVVVWVHGGGWNKGSKDNCPAVWLVTNGFAVASVQYRLTTQAPWPAQIQDCRDAVRWLRDHAEKHKLDAAHIGAWGSSAGGHLVALMGTLDFRKDEGTSARIQAVCDWYGPSDLLTMPSNTGPEDGAAKSNGAQLLGAPILKVPEKAKTASAFYQVTKGDAPFLIMHGDADPQVPIEQSQRLHEKLKETGVPSEYVVVQGGGHGGPLFNTPEVRQQVLKFFVRELKPAK